MANKAIFLDRDGTLIEDPGYINNPEQLKLLDGVPEALIELEALEYKLVVTTNQSGVARGIVTESVLGEIHNRLKQLLSEKGVRLDAIYYCPYHPDGVIPKYRKESDRRKPNPGMLLAAADEMDIDLSQSWAIGNSSRDVEAGLRAGCKTILINHSSHYKQPELGEPGADFQAVNIKEAVNIIKRHHRPSGERRGETEPADAAEPQPKLQAAEQPNHIGTPEAETYVAEPNVLGERSEQLLESILRELKNMQRANMFGEFSIMRLMAGVVQIIAVVCLLISIFFLMSPVRRDSSVFIALGFAIVLQVMALTFYIIEGRK